MAVSSVRYLASLVGMVSAAVVCGVRSTSVVRVWFSDGVVPADVAERCGVVCDVFDFGLEFECIDVLRSWFVGRDPLLGGDVSPCAFAARCRDLGVLREELFCSVRRLVFE